MTYGSAVWDTCSYDKIEKSQLTFIKSVLRVKSSTNNCMVYAEIGCIPIAIRIQTI